MPELPKVHRPKWADVIKRKAAAERNRRNQRKRCYDTGHSTWRRIRKAVLASEPMCRHCAQQGRDTPAREVDHIDGDTYNNSRENLCPLCKPCHSRKTVREQQA